MLKAGTLPIVLVALVLLNIFAVSPAQAHDSAVFYPHKWAASANVNYGFSTNFPSGNFRARVTDGKNQWNNTGGSAEPDFFGFNRDGSYYFFAPCYSPDGSGVLWFDRPKGVLASVTRCVAGGKVVRFSLAIDPGAGDTGRTWYTGTGDPPSNTHDLWSVAAHEFGHVTGWRGHFDETSSVCPSSTSRHTMCPSTPPGTAHMRTLQAHDRHTFESAY